MKMDTQKSRERQRSTMSNGGRHKHTKKFIEVQTHTKKYKDIAT